MYSVLISTPVLQSLETPRNTNIFPTTIDDRDRGPLRQRQRRPQKPLCREPQVNRVHGSPIEDRAISQILPPFCNTTLPTCRLRSSGRATLAIVGRSNAMGSTRVATARPLSFRVHIMPSRRRRAPKDHERKSSANCEKHNDNPPSPRKSRIE